LIEKGVKHSGMSLEVGFFLFRSFIVQYIFSVQHCLSVHTSSPLTINIVKITNIVIIGTKTQPEVIGILTPIKKIQLARPPQPDNNFRSTIYPSVTDLTNLTDKHGYKSLTKVTYCTTFNSSILQNATFINYETV